MDDAGIGRILAEGRNCWKTARADRVGFLVDAASYFAAFADAVRQARHSIFIIGWDIDSRIALVRGTNGTESRKLGEFLSDAVARKRGLHAYVLIWDFAMIYALEREFLPVFKLGWRTHPRLHFHLDGNHPVGASHHQKIVVIDDKLAFAGGIDLTKCRWDTPEHLGRDSRRYDPGCSRYSPFHDVQMAVDGDAAAALGELARERWRRATGRTPVRAKPTGDTPWPAGLTPGLENALIGISRTEPAHRGYPEIREVEALHFDTIRAARRTIYIENQYLTSSAIGELLAARLKDRNGPEVVIVLPLKSSGWLEENTMDALRARTLRRLREADRFGRLRVCYPTADGSGSSWINVHSKVTVIDNRFLRIGSANLSNRSMGFDTECDLSIEAEDNPDARNAIVAFRNRLLAEHLGVSPERIVDMIDSRKSVAGAIDALSGPGGSLRPLDGSAPDVTEEWLCDAPFVDPARPADPAELVGRYLPEESGHSGRLLSLGSAAILFALLALAAAWHWTGLRHWLNLDTILHWASAVRSHPAAPVLVIGAYALGGLIVFPVTLLMIATAITFSPFIAFLYSLLGCMASAVTLYGLGRITGRRIVRRFAGPGLNRLSRQLARRGLLAVITIRVLPVAPYTVVNFIAGASHIGLRDFVLGSVIGLTPGIFAITILGDRLGNSIRHPGLLNLSVVAGLVVLFAGLNVLVRHRLGRRKNEVNSAAPSGPGAG